MNSPVIPGMAGTIVCLMLVGWLHSSEARQNSAPSSQSVAALVAPEFSKALDGDAAATAFRAEDPLGLLAIAEKLAIAEHAAGKTNLPLPAITLYRLAIDLAQQKQDLKCLEQMESAIRAARHLSADHQRQLLSEAAVARKLAEGVRKINAGPGLKPHQVSAEAIALYNTFVNEIRITQEYGSEEELTQLLDAVRQLRELHPRQREHLLTLASTARVAIRERGNTGDGMGQLAGVTRSVATGLRILGPGETPTNGSISLVIIPAGPAGLKPGRLYLRSSPGTQVPDHVEWVGKPVVVPVTIKAAARADVFVSADFKVGANAVTWNARTARE